MIQRDEILPTIMINKNPNVKENVIEFIENKSENSDKSVVLSELEKSTEMPEEKEEKIPVVQSMDDEQSEEQFYDLPMAKEVEHVKSVEKIESEIQFEDEKEDAPIEQNNLTFDT